MWKKSLSATTPARPPTNTPLNRMLAAMQPISGLSGFTPQVMARPCNPTPIVRTSFNPPTGYSSRQRPITPVGMVEERGIFDDLDDEQEDEDMDTLGQKFGLSKIKEGNEDVDMNLEVTDANPARWVTASRQAATASRRTAHDNNNNNGGHSTLSFVEKAGLLQRKAPATVVSSRNTSINTNTTGTTGRKTAKPKPNPDEDVEILDADERNEYIPDRTAQQDAEEALENQKPARGLNMTADQILRADWKPQPVNLRSTDVFDPERPNLSGPQRMPVAVNASTKAVLDGWDVYFMSWCDPKEHNQNPLDHMRRRFGVHQDFYTFKNIDDAYNILKRELVSHKQAFELTGEKNNRITPRRVTTYEQEFVIVQKMMWDAFHALTFSQHYDCLRYGKEPPQLSEQMDLFRWKPINHNNLGDVQQFVLHVLTNLKKHKLRRNGDLLVEEKKTHDLHGTSFWQTYKSIPKFISAVTPKENKFDQWCNMLSGTAIRTAVAYLREADDADIQDHSTDWGVISFANCLYVSQFDKWYMHSDKNKPTHLTAQVYIDKNLDTREITGDLLSCFPSPIIKILQDQGYTPEEIFIFLALVVGRNFYKVGHLERWELAPFIYGLASTGKSTVLNLISKFFAPEDVARIGNKTEENFGLQGIYDKRFAACTDVTSKFRMETGDILSIISGEMCAINRKHQVMLSTLWICPVAFGGNEFPSRWIDKKNNLIRRIFIADFLKKIPVRDNSITRQLSQTLGSTYRLANLCYLKLVEFVGTRGDVWSFIPKRFIDNRSLLLRNNSPLLGFIFDSNYIQVKKEPNAYVFHEDLIREFKRWCEFNSLQGGSDCQPERFKEIMEGQDFEVKDQEFVEWPIGTNQHRKGRFIYGMVLVDQSHERPTTVTR